MLLKMFSCIPIDYVAKNTSYHIQRYKNAILKLKLFCILLGILKVNAEKVAVSGKKRTQKLYRRHSGRPGGMTVETFAQLQNRIPERIIEHAVRGMLPKGRVGSIILDISLMHTHIRVRHAKLDC